MHSATPAICKKTIASSNPKTRLYSVLHYTVDNALTVNIIIIIIIIIISQY